jgi:dihydrodipicolinate synthase/N-acetylneuraminate lyase
VSGLFLSPQQLVELLNDTGVVGMKDSALHLKSARVILEKCSHSAYFSGLSLLLPDLMNLGAAGAICPIGAIAPVLSTKLYKSCTTSDEKGTRITQSRLINLLPIVNMLSMPPTRQFKLLRFVTAFPVNLLKKASSPQAASKEALRLLGLDIKATVRRPLPALEGESSDLILECLKKARLM